MYIYYYAICICIVYTILSEPLPYTYWYIIITSSPLSLSLADSTSSSTVTSSKESAQQLLLRKAIDADCRQAVAGAAPGSVLKAGECLTLRTLVVYIVYYILAY